MVAMARDLIFNSFLEFIGFLILLMRPEAAELRTGLYVSYEAFCQKSQKFYQARWENLCVNMSMTFTSSTSGFYQKSVAGRFPNELIS